TRSRGGEGGARPSASTTRGQDDAGSRDAPNRGIGPSTFWAAQDVSLGTFSAEIGANVVLPPKVVKRRSHGTARRESRSGSWVGRRAGGCPRRASPRRSVSSLGTPRGRGGADASPRAGDSCAGERRAPPPPPRGPRGGSGPRGGPPRPPPPPLTPPT